MNWVSIGSDNSLLPIRRQAIIWTNVGILLIQTLGRNFSEILSKIHTFSFKKMHFKIPSKWWPFWSGADELTFLVLKLESNRIIRYIPWLLISCLLYYIRSWSTLLPDGTNYLNQCWFLINKILGPTCIYMSNANVLEINYTMVLEIHVDQGSFDINNTHRKKSFWFSVFHCDLAIYISSGNGLLPNITKPFMETMYIWLSPQKTTAMRIQ